MPCSDGAWGKALNYQAWNPGFPVGPSCETLNPPYRMKTQLRSRKYWHLWHLWPPQLQTGCTNSFLDHSFTVATTTARILSLTVPLLVAPVNLKAFSFLAWEGFDDWWQHWLITSYAHGGDRRDAEKTARPGVFSYVVEVGMVDVFSCSYDEMPWSKYRKEEKACICSQLKVHS